jgi:hypothetical protein
VQDDPIDSALADTVNQREKPLEINFARESPGIYIFGTKKISLRVENGRILIQVGQGQMGFDEFINTYTSLE